MPQLWSLLLAIKQPPAEVNSRIHRDTDTERERDGRHTEKPQVTAPNMRNHWVPQTLLQYSAAEYGAYPRVPKTTTHFMPTMFPTTEDTGAQTNIILATM